MIDSEANRNILVSDRERISIQEYLSKQVRISRESISSKTLKCLKESFAGEKDLENLRWEVFKKLQAYFLTIRYVTSDWNTSHLPATVVFMTKDEGKISSVLEGPIPLFFPYTEELEEISGEPYDYRELNDNRVAIIGLESGQVNGSSLEKFLRLNKGDLEEISGGIDERMQELQSPKEVKKYAELCLSWEKKTGITRSPTITEANKHNLESAMQALRHLSLGYHHAFGLVERFFSQASEDN